MEQTLQYFQSLTGELKMEEDAMAGMLLQRAYQQAFLVRLQCQARMKFWVPTGERIRSHHMYGIKTCTTPVCRLH